jgi:hypothetical protein
MIDRILSIRGDGWQHHVPATMALGREDRTATFEGDMLKTFLVLIGLMLSVVEIEAALAQTPGRAVREPSAADYPSIQAAIDDNPGRIVDVPAGDYDVSEKIQIGRQGGGLFGPGRIRQTNPGQPILVVEDATGVQSIEDCTPVQGFGAAVIGKTLAVVQGD